MKMMTTEEYIFRDWRALKRKHNRQPRYSRHSAKEGDMRLILARKYKMSCKQIRVIVETEKALAD